MRITFIIIIIFFVNTLYSKQIHIPNDFSDIQSGINAAENGDTVFVLPGTYKENIDFLGKNIILTSRYVFSNDQDDILQTIIDGDRRGSVVTIDKGENSSTELNGFTIINGLSWNGGGIICSQSYPELKNLIIKDNEANNFGGGIFLSNSDVTIYNVKITNNISNQTGGGLFCDFSNPHLTNVTINNNRSLKNGGGASFLSAVPVFNVEQRCNIYNNKAFLGNDLYVELEAPLISVVLDTFSITSPTSYFASPLDNFTFDILNGKIEQTASDLYVSPDGNNENSGLTVQDPLLSISIALAKIIADSTNPKTIHLANGTYSSSTTGDNFPLTMVDYVSLKGQSRDNVIIDADSQSNVIIFIDNFGVALENLTVTGGYTSLKVGYERVGAGIFCQQSDPILRNLLVTKNHALSNGGGIYFRDSNPTLAFVTVKENTSTRNGGGISYTNSVGIFENCTIQENRCDWNGGGIIFDRRTKSGTYLKNVSISANSALRAGGGIYIKLDDTDFVTFDSVSRCNIYMNHAGSGADIAGYFEDWDYTILPVFVDTFSVINPSDFFASPLSEYDFNIQNALLEQVDSDLYVNPAGDNTNSGLTKDEPLKSISFALSKLITDGLNPKTIYLANGTYSPSVNGEAYPLSMSKHIFLEGESEDGVILDAEGLSNILVFDSDSVISVSNLTITGGSAFQGGGIYAVNSNFDLLNITVRNNNVTHFGAGIYLDRSNVLAENITVKNNYSGRSGAGVFYSDSNGLLSNSHISDNVAVEAGAGICIWGYCEPVFSNVTVDNNHAFSEGGGVFISFASPQFDSEKRCNIYLNKASIGSDISLHETSLKADLDTFTVLNPGDHYAFPQGNIDLNILNAKIEPVDSDLYVNPDGNNSNSGLSADSPLKTISHALDLITADGLNPRTIFLAEGIYSTSTNGESFPLGLRSYVSISGESREKVILDAGNNSRVITISNKEEVRVENLTVNRGNYLWAGGILCEYSKAYFDNLVITDNTAPGGGAGISFYYSAAEMQNSIISNNRSAEGYGGGIECTNSTLHLNKVTISDNYAFWNGGGIYCWQSNPVLVNVTISGNKAGFHGGGIFGVLSNPFLVNTILWNNWPEEIFFEDQQNSNIIAYSNIRAGEFGVISNNKEYVTWLGNNFAVQPLFVNADSGNFHLQDNSPCIDKGIAFLVWQGDTITNIPEDAYHGNAPDLGAYESTITSDIKDDIFEPEIFYLNQNYPNPFNPVTSIQYQVPKLVKVEISIFNILGQKIATLISRKQPPGKYIINFDGSSLSSGIYIYRIEAGSFSQTRKMVLIK